MKFNISGTEVDSTKVNDKDGTILPNGSYLVSSNAVVFRTPSASRQGKMHFTVVSSAWTGCTCEGFQFKSRCKHIDQATEYLANQIDITITSVTQAEPITINLNSTGPVE